MFAMNPKIHWISVRTSGPTSCPFALWLLHPLHLSSAGKSAFSEARGHEPRVRSGWKGRYRNMVTVSRRYSSEQHRSSASSSAGALDEKLVPRMEECTDCIPRNAFSGPLHLGLIRLHWALRILLGLFVQPPRCAEIRAHSLDIDFSGMFASPLLHAVTSLDTNSMLCDFGPMRLFRSASLSLTESNSLQRLNSKRAARMSEEDTCFKSIHPISAGLNRSGDLSADNELPESSKLPLDSASQVRGGNRHHQRFSTPFLLVVAMSIALRIEADAWSTQLIGSILWTCE